MQLTVRYLLILALSLVAIQGLAVPADRCSCTEHMPSSGQSELMLRIQTSEGICRRAALVQLFSGFVWNQELNSAVTVLRIIEKEAFDPCEDSLRAEYQFMRGRYFSGIGEKDSSIACYTRAATLANNLQNSRLEVMCLGDIARDYMLANLTDQALEYYRKAIHIAKTHHLDYHLDNLYGNLASAYGYAFGAGLGEVYLDSVEWAELISIRYAVQTKDTSSLIFAYTNLANVHVNRGNTAMAFLYCDSILRVVEPTNPSFLYALSTKSEAYYQREDLANAIFYADSALKLARRYATPLEQVIAMEMLSGFYAEAGRYKEAYLLHLELKQLEDSVNSVDRTRVISELEQSFNKERNEQTIAALLKDTEIQDLNIRILAGVVILAVLLLVLGIILYRQQTLRSRQRILETEQRLNRARMDPHFFFNMLTALQGLALDPERMAEVPLYLSKYARLMRRTLESTFSDMVAISDETAFLEEYLDLQSVRFPGKFTWTIHVDESLDPDGILVPSMLIQPFAENAVEHGFRGMSSGGHLDIRFTPQGKTLQILIEDNGTGEGGDGKSFPSRAGQIVRDRLFLLRKQLRQDCSCTTLDTHGKPGYAVEIRLPLIQG